MNLHGKTLNNIASSCLLFPPASNIKKVDQVKRMMRTNHACSGEPEAVMRMELLEQRRSKDGNWIRDDTNVHYSNLGETRVCICLRIKTKPNTGAHSSFITLRSVCTSISMRSNE